ncbi:MAG: hypothetical protein GY856_31940 [bacterium]|nr:hypothetical protein [bacterium]
MEHARQGCERSGPGLLAVHLLGYLAPHPAKNVEVSEIGLLRSLVTGASCPNGRLFAAQALALRSPEIPNVWRQAADRAPNAWERRQLIRAFWVRQPEALANEALDRLENEPTQLVQWKLTWGLVHHEQGLPLRDLRGLWFLSPHFQFRLENARRFDVLGPEAVDRILDWLEHR